MTDTGALYYISEKTGVSHRQVTEVIELLEQDCTVPFIARYRKERTVGLDETVIISISEELSRQQELAKRKKTIVSTIEESGKLTEELKDKIVNCFDSVILEDIYLPYKPKKKTRAEVARQKGLEKLAALIMRQDGQHPEIIAGKFLNEHVLTKEEALQGASDIIAEWVSENLKVRDAVRRSFMHNGIVVSSVVRCKETEGTKYRDYFQYRGRIKSIPAHRLQAILRGEKEGFLKYGVELEDENSLLDTLSRIVRAGNSASGTIINESIRDSFKRLLRPSIITEVTNHYRELADDRSIDIFGNNLRQLLLAPALGPKRVMGIDPGYRTGCKVVILDEHGTLMENTTIYPHPPQLEKANAAVSVKDMVDRYKVEYIAVGDGTAGRETEEFLRDIQLGVAGIVLVDEDGASVYSASETARKEFPDKDITVRGAVSIGRRLMDPLAELIKIDPKSIGVGQYQHDVDQKKLNSKLGSVVESAVNNVGVNINTASAELLGYISGIKKSTASEIVRYRNENGSFKSREELKKVKGLGSKSFEQAAGFLRIPESDNPLDNTAVHPESYSIAAKIAAYTGLAIGKLAGNKEVLSKLKPEDFVTESVGIPTIKDIIEELEKPGRDPRGSFENMEFDDRIRTIEDLKTGMELNGKITNLTAFGAFVDLGIKKDGLIHISRMSQRRINDPSEIFSVGQNVKVVVTEIEPERGRISLDPVNRS